MGSKRWMLRNGLGSLLRREAPRARRFIDLFTGSGAVACFVAEQMPMPVRAFDLQFFCIALADSVIGRTEVLDPVGIWENWLRKAVNFLNSAAIREPNCKIPARKVFTASYVAEVRSRCANEKPDFVITRAYGGHYFSRTQALWIDALRATLPANAPERTVALSALICASSQCVAAPGHTAQPFQPTRSAKPFLYSAWSADVVKATKEALEGLAIRHALRRGQTSLLDANEAAEKIRATDLVFIDPPYSGVHYSRFYHVLETLACGGCAAVSGVGRYPPTLERPTSLYSMKSHSREAITDLLHEVAERGATAIITFPDKRCSNGISSDLVKRIGSECFRRSEEMIVRGRFSTLGGNGNQRDARQPSSELVLVLRS